METRGRALFNLIRMNWQEDHSLPVEDWQVEDYRSLPIEEIFKRLEVLGISLDESRFRAVAEAVSSPEELTEALWVDEENAEGFDKAYLLLFELWRRILPENQSLSVFCDHLDYLIDLYDQGNLINETSLQDALADLERILDQHVDQGENPHQIFEEISLYFAHDLKSFIYDYISDQIDRESFLYASEIYDAFEPFVHQEKWFEFLHIRLLANTDQEESNRLLAELIEDQKEDPDLEFLLDVARHLIHRGAIPYFIQTVKQTRHLIETEQDFQELLAITSQFYTLLDREEKAKKVKNILSVRQSIPLEKEIAPSDPDVEEFYQLVEDHDWSEA